MTEEQHQLKGFEQRLLAELTRVIVAQGPSRPVPVSDVRARFGRRRLALVGGVAAVVAAALATGLPLVDGGSGPAAAHAVTTNDDGTVTVEINALRDAEGLERELRDAGVPADVRYLPPGKECDEDTFTLVTPAGSGAGTIEAREDGSMRFEIDKRSLRPGQKLFIYTRDLAPGQPGGHPGQPASAIGFSIVDEKVVVDCDAVASP